MSKGKRKVDEEALNINKKKILSDYERTIYEFAALKKAWENDYKKATKPSERRGLAESADLEKKKFLKIKKTLIKKLDSVLEKLAEAQHLSLTNSNQNKEDKKKEDLDKNKEETKVEMDVFEGFKDNLDFEKEAEKYADIINKGLNGDKGKKDE